MNDISKKRLERAAAAIASARPELAAAAPEFAVERAEGFLATVREYLQRSK